MRLALAGAAAFAAYAVLSHVTYLNTGGYSADWPEYRRIAVVPASQCEAVLDRAQRTLGEGSGIRCESVPLYRHWTNMVRAAYASGGATSVAHLVLGGEAVAQVAQAETAR